MQNVKDIVGQYSGRKRKVLDYVLITKEIVDKAEDAQIGPDYWNPLGDLTDTLKFTAGARYVWNRMRAVVDQRIYLPGYPETMIPGMGIVSGELFPSFLLPAGNPFCTVPSTIATNCQITLVQKSNKPTWTASLDYALTPDAMLYAKYSRGYRAGTIAPSIAPPLNMIKPEKVDSYEAGVKTSFHGAVPGNLNISGFYNDFSNQQLQLAFNGLNGNVSTAAPVNAGKSRIWGFEADANLRPFTGFSLSGGYTYLNTEITKIPDFSTLNDPNYHLNATFQVGDPQVLSPRHKFTASAAYTLPLDESVGRITFGATYTYRTKMMVNYSDRVNPNPEIAAFSWMPSLSLLNLNASWTNIADSNLNLSLFMTNVTKEKYHLFSPGVGGTMRVNFEVAGLGEPRMYGLRLKYNFGR